jgi:hypothetical protein
MTFSEILNSEYLIQCFLDILSAFAEVFSILTVILIATCFMGRNAKLTKKCFLFPGVYLLFGILAVIVDISSGFKGSELFNFLYMFLSIAVTICTAWTVYDKKKIRRSIESVIMVILVESYVQFILVDTYAFISGDVVKVYNSWKYQTLYPQFNTFYILSYFSIFLIAFLVLYFGLYKKQSFIYVGWSYRLIFIFWVLLMAIIPAVVIESYVNNSVEIRRLESIFGYGLILFGLIVPFIIFSLVSRNNAVEKIRIQEGYIEAELEYINKYKKSQDETRAFRHDIVNNLSLLSVMLKEGKQDEAEGYLNELLGNIKGTSPKYVTGDEMLDCIVGMKAMTMDEKGISFEIDGVIDGGLKMNAIDVCNIFANAIDNAIEACEKLSDDSKKWIKFTAKKTDKFVNIQLENSMISQKNGVAAENLFEGVGRKTSKKDKNLHGFGTINMKNALEKYGGMLKAKEEDNVFSLSLLIPR